MTIPAKSLPASTLKALPTVKATFEDLGARFNLTPRASQIKLAELTRNMLAGSGVGCFEAPTGTGKTLGYLAGALEAQAHASNPVPVVIATATVGLQEQILRHDIPRLAAVGAIDPRKVAVAKGRGRYFCPRTAALLEDKKSQDNQFDMFNADKHVAEGGTPVALDMLKAWRAGEWDGDRDNWAGIIPECWGANCGASSDTCVNRACEYFEKCPYMASRAKLGQAQIIIANHDIVLADLTQRAEEQQSTALPPKNYWLIIDEAHNLPDKAVQTKRASANLTDTDWLRGIAEYGDRCLSTIRIERALVKANLPLDVFALNSAILVAELATLSKDLVSTRKFDDGGASSWGMDEPEKELKMRVFRLAGNAYSLIEGFKACTKAYSDFAEEAIGSDKAFAIRMLAQTHKLNRLTKSLYDGLEMFCTKDRVVRWVLRTPEERVLLESQPLEGQDVLQELMWKAEIPVVLVSATLQIAGSFSRFKDKAGLPARTVCEALPPVFDYTRGYLHQPRMANDPSSAAFEAEVTEKLVKLYDNEVAPGMLVLFTSRQSMRRVVNLLPVRLSSRALVQDHRPIPELVAQHKAIIDRGGRSMLIGLDSMAEGLDLPGKYCGHVVITRLPFAVPGDPVEEARRAHLGRAWFEQAYLADMLTMLIQAAGRLIRREDDHGVITILDRRLSSKGYAGKAMSALPGFSRGTNLQGYFDMLKARGMDPSHGTTAPPAPAPLKLVSSRKKTPAPAPTPVSAAAEIKEAAPIVPDSPLAALWRLKAVPAPTGKAARCPSTGLAMFLHNILPFTPGPFGDEEVEFLSKRNTAYPCLPAGAPWSTWGERQMPQAVMLGLRLMNMSWDESKPIWFQVMSLRPDLVQFAEILRSHEMNLYDERRNLVSAEVCGVQLQQGMAGLGVPDEYSIFACLDMLESEALVVLSNAHVLPSRAFMSEMPNAALRLASESRSVR
jgi:ATP-dependent DNA helicase DinG